MSILIKGMKMPKSCSECRMLEGDRDDGLCHAAERWLDDEYWRWFTFEEGDIDDSMPSNCPLVELPDHGDLIDRDELKHGFCVECTLYPDNCLKEDCDWDNIYHIDHAPVVIPAGVIIATFVIWIITGGNENGDH